MYKDVEYLQNNLTILPCHPQLYVSTWTVCNSLLAIYAYILQLTRETVGTVVAALSNAVSKGKEVDQTETNFNIISNNFLII